MRIIDDLDRRIAKLLKANVYDKYERDNDFYSWLSKTFGILDAKHKHWISLIGYMIIYDAKYKAIEEKILDCFRWIFDNKKEKKNKSKQKNDII